MSNKIANRQAMCETLIEKANDDKDLLVLTSDSRGSASLIPFAEKFPDRIIEVGIAEQNIVGIAAGLAHSGKKAFAVSPACFLSMRSIEQVKVDVAYSQTNVKLVGISGGVSYGALGMSHHSLQDFAVTRAIPGLQVLCPADRFETEAMFNALVDSPLPAYIRLGRNPVEDCYENSDYDFKIGQAVKLREGKDITLVATGEMVRVALDAEKLLQNEGIQATVLNYHTIKPFDVESLLESARKTKLVVSIEEHSIFGGLGSSVAEVLSSEKNIVHHILGIPDEPVIAGSSSEIFKHYHLDAPSISKRALEWIEDERNA